MRAVHVQRRAPGVPPTTARAVRRAVEAAMDRLGVPAESEVAVVLGADSLLVELNYRYRGIDAVTDVLSFAVDAPELPATEAPYLGDIVISVEQAERQAAEVHASTLEELRLLAVHGLLHLLGYDDSTEAGAEEMRRCEIALGVR